MSLRVALSEKFPEAPEAEILKVNVNVGFLGFQPRDQRDSGHVF